MNVTNSGIESVLAEMRALAARASSQKPAVPAAEQGAFGQLFKQTVAEVNRLQSESAALTAAFESGEAGIDLAQVMATQKANVSFQALTQVRNKFVDAYKEIMNMPV